MIIIIVIIINITLQKRRKKHVIYVVLKVGSRDPQRSMVHCEGVHEKFSKSFI